MKRLAGYLYYLATGVRVGNLELQYKWRESAVQTLSKIASKYNSINPVNWETLGFEETRDAKELGEILTKYGSDKSARHKYHLLYAKLLKRNEPFVLLEVGLGKVSTVIKGECASMRAFKEWAPKAELYGMDIEKRLLIQEDRIHTFWADQFEPQTLVDAASNIPGEIDLIIDDGLHRPWTNFNTIYALLPRLKPGGTMVIEDIEDNFHFWPPLIASLSSKYECRLIRMNLGLVCIITKRH